MNSSLLYLVLALSSSWGDAQAAVQISSGPTPNLFSQTEPVGLFDEITSPLAESTKPSTPPFRSLLRAQRDTIIRAQNPTYILADGSRNSPGTPRTFLTPTQPNQPAQQYVPSEIAPSYEERPPVETPPLFAQPAPNPAPYMTAPPPAAMPGATTWGANGPQPYRLGYSLWTDIGWLPNENISLGGKGLEILEVNVGLNHTIPTWWSPWLFSLQHEFGYRSWDGPSAIDLPGSVYRFGWDVRLETPLNSEYAPFAFSFAFNPSINSDFDHSLTSNAINLDGRGIMFFQADPHWLIALGAGFWDRVEDRIIPYAGFVCLPDDRWEFRIMWPQSRIQYYLGNHFGEDMWLYATGEYHIESYEIGTTSSPTGRDQIELEDYRILLGLRKSNPIASGFIEGGWVFGRKGDLRVSPGSDFSISSGAIVRVGLRF